MTHWDMYWFTRLDYLQGFFITMTFVAVARLFVLAMNSSINEDGTFKKNWWKIMIVGMILGAISCFIPTQKEAAAIWLVPKMVNNEKLNNIASDTLSILEKKTQLYLKEMIEPGKESE